MRVKVILNPYANRWGAGKRADDVRAAFSQADLSFDLSITEEPGEAISLAYQAAADGYDAVVAAGGDGTISEVANGLMQAAGDDAATLPLGIVPIGTANDFSDMVDIPRDLKKVADLIAAGKTRQIDAGKLTFQENGEVNIHYFNNNCAVAMEPMVTLEHIKMTRLSGEIRYLVALVRGIVKLKAWQMRIMVDSQLMEGPTYLLSICNSPRTGGFYMAPDARVDDGELDYVFAPEISKPKVLAVLVRLLRGTHIHHEAVQYGRGRKISIESQPGTPVHCDGEIVAEAATTLTYEVLPGKLTLLTL